MNIYDFDGTIYDGDSSVDFYTFCLKKNPRILKFLPRQVKGVLMYKLGIIDKTNLKSLFFCFLRELETFSCVDSFWEQNEIKIQDWYLKQHRDDDIVISASPNFLLKPICEKLGISRLIASRIDAVSGVFAGENCRGKEKVNRLYKEYGIKHFDKFYSDSYSDMPLALMANEAFMVKRGKIYCWERHRRR